MSADSPPSAPTDANGSRGSPFWRHVSRVTDRLGELAAFAVVPLFATLLETESVRRTLEPARGGFSISFDVRFPAPVLDLWSFTDPPEPPRSTSAPGSNPFGGSPAGEPAGASQPGTGGDATGFDLPSTAGSAAAPEIGGGLLALFVLFLVVYAAVFAVVHAGYLGGIHRRLRGDPAAIGDCIRTYAGRFFAYQLLAFGTLLTLVLLAVFSPVIVLLAIPLYLVVVYLFYAVPFLFVVDDAPFLEAFVRSYRFAVDGGSYLSFTLWHLVVTLLASIVLSIVVSVSGPLALLLALAVVCPLSLVLSAATVSFLDELVEGERIGGSEPVQ